MRPNRDPAEETGTTLTLALGLWAAAVVAGAAAGVFAKFSPELVAALAIFATLFAAGSYRLDPNVREFVRGRDPRPLRTALAVLVALSLFDLLATPWDARFAAWPHAVVTLFALPLAVAMSVALLDRAERPVLRSPVRKSPGARPAAT